MKLSLLYSFPRPIFHECSRTRLMSEECASSLEVTVTKIPDVRPRFASSSLDSDQE